MNQPLLEKAFWAMLVVVLWVVKELVTFIVKQRKGEYKKLNEGSGELPEAKWILNITQIEESGSEKLRLRLKEDADRNQSALVALITSSQVSIIKEIVKNGK